MPRRAEPSYEWRVVGDAVGKPLATGALAALYNEVAGDFLVKGDRTWGVNLKWYKDTLPPEGGGDGGVGGGASPGWSTLLVYNCISEQRPLEMWVWDVTAGSGWVDMGRLEQQWSDSGCPQTGSPWKFTPISGHAYIVKGIDFLAPGCSNDPTIGSCARKTIEFVGDANGPPLVR